MFLTKIKISRQKLYRKKSFGGRNNQGTITVRHKKLMNRKLVRVIDWKKMLTSSILIELCYNPKHSSMLGKYFNYQTKEYFFYPLTNVSNFLDSNNEIKNIFQTPLNHFMIGSFCNNIFINGKSRYSTSSGTFTTVVQRYTWIKNYMLLRLPSGEQKLFLNNLLALPGQVRGSTFIYEQIKKAGRNRWLGKRPTVRGVAMNPVDHPHGGGEGKTSGGRPSVSKWGKLTKNVKTRKNKRDKWKIIQKRKK